MGDKADKFPENAKEFKDSDVVIDFGAQKVISAFLIAINACLVIINACFTLPDVDVVIDLGAQKVISACSIAIIACSVIINACFTVIVLRGCHRV